MQRSRPAPKSMLRKYASSGRSLPVGREGVTEGVTNQKGSAAMAKRGAPEGRWPATLGLAIIYVYVVRSLD